MKTLLKTFPLLLLGCGSSTSEGTGGNCTYNRLSGHTLQYKGSTLMDSSYVVEYQVIPSVGTFENAHAVLSASCKNEFESKNTVPADIFTISAGACAPVIIQPVGLSNSCNANFQY